MSPPEVEALTLTEVQRSLGLFAEAVAGHVVRIEALGEDRVGWPWDLSLPEPDRIELPPTAASGDSVESERRIYRSQALHQVALVQFGTFGEPDAPDRAAILRHPRLLESPQPGLAAGLVVMLEHLRVNAATQREYPGARGDLEAVLAEALARRLAHEHIDDRAGMVAALHLRCLEAPLEEIEVRCPRVASGDVVWLCALTDTLIRPGAALDDTVRVAIEIAGRMTSTVSAGSAGTEPLVEIDDATSNSANSGEAREESELDGIGAVSGPVDGTADEKDGNQDGVREAGPVPFAEELEQVERSIGAPGRGSTPSATEISGDERTFLYDEWDYRRRRYEPGWCRLVERRVEGADHDFIAGVRRRHAELGREIRHQFSRLRPEDRMRVHRCDDGEELDLDAMIEAIVDQRSGAVADDRLGIRRERVAREVATAFLVDLSASTSSPIEAPEPPAPTGELDGYDLLLDPAALERPARIGPPPRRIIDVAKDAVALMCDALERLGDRHAVYGFSGHGRLNVDFSVSKEFDDATSPSAWAALAALEPFRYTRMGPAIRHASAKLAATGARTKLLIVISDGHPQDIDYGPDRGDKTHGVQDTAKAVVEAARVGVDAFCVTIDPAGNDYLGSMFPESRYLVIEDVEALPKELAKLYLNVARPTAPASGTGPARRGQARGGRTIPRDQVR